MTRSRHLRLAVALTAVALAASACAPDSGGPRGEPPSPAATTPGDGTTESTVTLLTHDSFNVSEDVLAAFTRSSGVEVEVLRGGDAGVMVNQAILSRDNPQADVLFGVDNTFLSRALDAGLFVPYESPLLADVDDRFVLDEQHRVTPVDYGDVCLNYDREAFAGGGRALPERLEDLTEPEHAGTLVVENPATSSPGLAFMLATIERFGEDGWLEYWEGLRANDVAVAAGWEDAYYGQFSGASGEGDRPLVVSYASSPPAEVYFAETPPPEPPTGVITDGCFRQIEFVGILAGTDQEAGAQALVDFMVGREFQEDLPLQMFVFPVRGDAVLPEVFVAHAVIPDDPIEMDYQRIGERREEWIEEWTAAVLR